jgi:hypothetical protein
VAKPSWRNALSAFWQTQRPLAVFSLATMALLLGLSVWLAITLGRVQSGVDGLQAQQLAAFKKTEKKPANQSCRTIVSLCLSCHRAKPEAAHRKMKPC